MNKEHKIKINIMKEIMKEYTNGEITVMWKPAKCIHASFCWKELPEVFDPNKRPWVNMEGASSERIRKQVERCPSGALTYYENKEKQKDTAMKEQEEKTNEVKVQVIQGGPLIIHSNVEVTESNGEIVHQIAGVAFCRCGQSRNQPYCDGTHERIGFVN